MQDDKPIEPPGGATLEYAEALKTLNGVWNRKVNDLLMNTLAAQTKATEKMIRIRAERLGYKLPEDQTISVELLKAAKNLTLLTVQSPDVDILHRTWVVESKHLSNTDKQAVTYPYVQARRSGDNVVIEMIDEPETDNAV